jgi:hypothetical protein
MGWDSYCCICGNSCFGTSIDTLLEISSIHKKNIEIKELKKIIDNIKWMNKKITLYANNKIKKIKKNDIFFECEQYLPYKSDEEYGIFAHFDCWYFIKVEYGIEVKYKHLPVNYIDINKNSLQRKPPLMKIKYGDISKYWDQDFNFYQLYLDNNMYMLQSPLSDDVKNINRIKKIITQFKLKKNMRPSPSVSATFYKNNIIKIGNNNKFWIIKNGKWNEINENILCKKYIILYNKLHYIDFIPQIGEYSLLPLFINNITIDKKKKFATIELLCINNYITEFENNKKISKLLNNQ